MVAGAKPTILCITQARVGSSRLPEKILLPVLGQPLLKYHLDRLQRANRLDKIVVATTDKDEDRVVAQLCSDWGVDCIRGPSEDVLSRFALAVAKFDPKIVVRVTSDCPLIDPEVVDQLCERFDAGDEDYLALDIQSFPHGLDCEIMSRAAFDAADLEAENSYEREHVTPFIYLHPDRFRIGKLSMAESFPEHRWTVDYPEDFEFVKAVIEGLYPNAKNFGWREVVNFLADNPKIMALNAGIEARWQQKLQDARTEAGIC